MSEPLTSTQLREQEIRLNGVPVKPIPEVFSATLAKQIQKNEDLRFTLHLIQNALELGQPEMALAQCKKAWGEVR